MQQARSLCSTCQRPHRHTCTAVCALPTRTHGRVRSADAHAPARRTLKVNYGKGRITTAQRVASSALYGMAHDARGSQVMVSWIVVA